MLLRVLIASLLIFVVFFALVKWVGAQGGDEWVIRDLCGQDVSMPEWMILTCTPASDTAGGHWQLSHFEVVTPEAGGGNHHYFIKLFDDGAQLADLPFSVAWKGGSDTVLTKPIPSYGDIPLWQDYDPFAGEEGPYRGFAGLVSDEAASDTVDGMGLPLRNHWSFVAEYEWVDQEQCVGCAPTLWMPMVAR